MKKKKFLSTVITLLMVFSPLFLLPAKTRAANNDDAYTVILKPGNGSGDDVVIKSTDSGAMAESEVKAEHGQFFAENDSTYYCTPLSAPRNFEPPTDKQYSFCGWTNEQGEFIHDEDVKLNDSNNNTLTLTAVWNDSYFELETDGTVEIKGPGYNDFVYTLKDLHLGSNNLGNGNKLIVDSVELEFRNGTLESTDGKTLPYLVCPTYGVPGKKAVTESFTEADIGKQFKISIYISKDDYEKAQATTYTCDLKCTGIYACHPHSSDDPDASSPNYIFETKKFRGESVLISSSVILTYASNSEEEVNSLTDAPETEAISLNNTTFPQTDDSANIVQLLILVGIGIFGFTATKFWATKKHRSM